MTRRDRIVLIVVAVVAAIAASWILVVSPKRDQAAKLQTKVAAEQAKLDSARTTLAQNAAASKQYASNYAALARLGEAVPASDDIPSLIIQLQNAADGAKVDF
jgi:Tfp pilus assembly protein PilO